jgi:uncharacterized protein (TIGR02300 family)
MTNALRLTMPEQEWGVKRTCLSCASRFYDLNNDPCICPNCGAEAELAAFSLSKSKATQDAKAKAAAKVEAANQVDDADVLDDDDDVDLADDDVLVDDDDDDVSLDEIADVAKEDDD